MNKSDVTTDVSMIVAANAVTFSGATIATYLFGSANLLVTLTTLMVLDLITGLMASYSCGEEISSRKWKLGLMGKVAFILMLGSLGILFRTYYPEQIQTAMTWLFWSLSMAEAMSIVGNSYATAKGKRLPEVDVIGIIIGRIRAALAEALGLDVRKGK